MGRRITKDGFTGSYALATKEHGDHRLILLKVSNPNLYPKLNAVPYAGWTVVVKGRFIHNSVYEMTDIDVNPPVITCGEFL